MSSLSPATPVLETESTLNVGLQAVLRSLDVGLEDELTRYRRKRRAQAPLSGEGTAVPAKAHSANAVQTARTAIAQLTSIPSMEGMDTGAAASVAVAAPPAETSVSPESTTASAAFPVMATALGAVPLESSLVSLGSEAQEADAGSASEAQPAADDYFASSAALLETLTAEGEVAETAVPEAKMPNQVSKLMTPVGMGASMLLLLGSATAGYLVLHPESLNHLQVAELLPQRNAAGSVASQTSAPKLVNPDLPPGAPDLSQKEFVDLTLSNLGSLSLNDLGQSSVAQTADLAVATLPTVPAVPGGFPQTTLPGTSVAGGGGANAAAAIAPQPPQSNGLLSNLANAVAGPAPALQMTPEMPLPTVIQPPAAAMPIAPALPVAPAPEPYQAPAPEPVQEAPVSYEAAPVAEPEFYPEEVAVAPEPAVEAEAASVGEPANAYGTFVVMTPYNSDLALSQVQQLVPDAFVENTDSGAFIQAGIFDDAETAQSLVDQLQREGLNASVEAF